MWFDLKQYRVIEIIGDDAEKYLQGQLTCDVAKLENGEATFCAHCDAKGKVVSLFHLIRINHQQFFCLMRADLLEQGLAHLKKYAVFSKVTFVPQDWQLLGSIDEEQTMSARYILPLIQHRYVYIAPENTDFIHLETDVTQWDLRELQSGYPLLPAQEQGEYLPQALNIQCLEQAISFQKGCYIGQEMVARAKYRGANKRAMFVFCANVDHLDDYSVEMSLESGWRNIGLPLSAVHFNGELWLQVVMNKQVDSGTLFRLAEKGIPLEPCTLPYEIS